jgi:hypothetical protein
MKYFCYLFCYVAKQDRFLFSIVQSYTAPGKLLGQLSQHFIIFVTYGLA